MKQFKGLSKAFWWLTNNFEGPNPLPLRFFNALKDLKINVVSNGSLATRYTKTKLSPIIFSHGNLVSRSVYSLLHQELASHGFIVFALDHHDGSCHYTETSDGKSVPFKVDIPYFNYEYEHQAVVTRQQEVSALIDEISKDNFLQNVLKMDQRVCLDLDNIVVCGHSKGGATALRVGHADKRAKFVTAFDPWFPTLYKEIEDGTFNGFSEQQSL